MILWWTVLNNLFHTEIYSLSSAMVLGFSAFSGFSALMYPIIQFSWDALTKASSKLRLGICKHTTLHTYFFQGLPKLGRNPRSTEFIFIPLGFVDDLQSDQKCWQHLCSDFNIKCNCSQHFWLDCTIFWGIL